MNEFPNDIESLKGLIKQLLEEHAQFDETGVRVGGKQHWLHTASTEQHTYLFIYEKRGVEALRSETSVLKDFKGTAVHDCWSPYFRFEKARQVLCGAHWLRELAGLMEKGSLWAKPRHEFLLDWYKHIILAQAQLEEPPPKPGKRGKPKQSTGRNLLNRLKKPEQGVLAFALEAGVPFTNNQTERDLRPAKVKQPVSGCFCTHSGACVYARLQGAASTFRKQGLNVFVTLHELFSLKAIAVK